MALPEVMRTGGFETTSGRMREVYPDGYPITRRALARMYRITRQQFACVLRGENSISGVDIDPANALGDRRGPLHKNGVVDLSDGALYNLCLFLGSNPQSGNEPIYTFTGSPESVDPAFKPPSEPYLCTVIAGLLETYGEHLGDLELAAYLSDALCTGIDPTHKPVSGPDADVLGLIQAARARNGPPAPSGHYAVVERTRDRSGSRREFIACLRRHPALAGVDPIGLEEGDLFVTSRSVIDRVHLDLREDGSPRRYLFVPASPKEDGGSRPSPVARLRVPAVLLGERAIDPSVPSEEVGPPRLRGCPVAAHALALDEKIRVGLGVNTGDVVGFAPELGARPEYAPRGARHERQAGGPPVARLARRMATWLGGRLEWAVGSQPVLMRVDFATPVDMEIGLCRMAREVFDVIGVGPGDHIKVVSADGVRVGLRAVEMTDAQARRRKVQQERMPQWFLAHLLRPDMRRVRRMSTDSELPVIYLDLDARQRLRIDTGEVVRVVRDPLRNLGLRVYIVVVPSVLVLARALISESGPDWTTPVAIAAVLIATLFVLWLELRLKISR
ncbi:MAG: hypothetical protein NCW75_07315 [Phycisphaera sp.]|nr:MAG: hypothetical protein NCW75_07315 [Phycisphaera sp.]